MNYTESFDQFASRIGPTDLALYAGAGIILFILFKDKLSPVQHWLLDLKEKYLSSSNGANLKDTSSGVVSAPLTKPTKTLSKEDLFFDLVVSWKKTRDLAVRSGCSEAIKVADQMFPFLSPNTCVTKSEDTIK